MFYRAEIVVDSKVKVAENFTTVSHPRQAIRKIVEKMERSKVQSQRMIVIIMNENGQVWIYHILRKGAGYSADEQAKVSDYLNRSQINMIMTGNKTVSECVL